MASLRRLPALLAPLAVLGALVAAPAATAPASPAPSVGASATTDELPPTTPVASWQPRYPIRAAFYYPWYPSGFTVPGSRYEPTAGRYSVDDAATVKRHVHTMRWMGMNAGIASWWGPRTDTDRRLPGLLRAAEGGPFRWALYYEMEGYADPTPAQIDADLGYLMSRYTAHPAYLKIGGRPVLFVWTAAEDGCDTARRWEAGNVLGFHLVLKRVNGFATCPQQPEEWHQYAPALRTARLGTASFAVSPGFWHHAERTPRLPRSVWEFDKAVRAMKASGARWQLVTTFNEWGEGTSVESAPAWAGHKHYGKYVKVLHDRLGIR